MSTVPRNTKCAITREKFRYIPPAPHQNYASYYMPHKRNHNPLIASDFREEENQNEIAVKKIEDEIDDIKDKIKIITDDEKRLKESKRDIIEKQEKVKEGHSQVLMEITKVRAEIRDGEEDTKSIDEIRRYYICENFLGIGMKLA